MLTMMVMLYNWIWENEYVPRRWREGSSSKIISRKEIWLTRGTKTPFTVA